MDENTPAPASSTIPQAQTNPAHDGEGESPEELAKALRFPRWFDDPHIHDGIEGALGTGNFYDMLLPALQKHAERLKQVPPTLAEIIETERKNRLAQKERGRRAFVEGDAVGFLCSAGSEHGMEMVYSNLQPLFLRGIYEKALVFAITDARGNNHDWPLYVLRDLFLWANRARLRAAGDPLPGSGPFTLYRGVAGKTERDRRIRGISWTGTLAKAAWFADRWHLPNPEVYKCTVEATHVLAYVDDRHEDEYIVLLPRSAKIERVPWPEPKAAA